MAEGYYYLITSLPDLSLADKDPGYTVTSFRDGVMEHLNPDDARLMRVLFYRFDIENLVNLVTDGQSPWRDEGNYSIDQLQFMLSSPETLPVFMRAFVQETNREWDRLSPKVLLNKATTYFIDWSHRVPN